MNNVLTQVSQNIDSTLGNGSSSMVYSAAIIWYVLVLIGRWKVYNKAGYSGLWSILPIVSDIVMCKMIRISPWLLLLTIVLFVNVVFLIYYAFAKASRLATYFGKGFGTKLMIFFFEPIAVLYLGFGSAQYNGYTW
ncbi:MAG: DUF5684 domain-containing protein [Thomasclavelia sp.]|jgi:hypothetical protein|nr:DUF5684 domain-containing protein [Thomasclavelia sp.]